LARPLIWYSNIATIKADAEKSPIETWDRRSIEALFGNVSRATAQQIMKAIGGIENVHRVYTVSRASLLGYLERMYQAEDPHIEHNRKIEGHEAIPRAEKVTVPIPDRMKAVMVRDLPDGIVLEPGHLAFNGDCYQQVLELVGAFLMACKNDPDTVIALLNQPSKSSERVDDELRSLFAGLREREQSHAESQRVVCMNNEYSTAASGEGEEDIRSSTSPAPQETPLQYQHGG
jgi:hypothetical protein